MKTRIKQIKQKSNRKNDNQQKKREKSDGNKKIREQNKIENLTEGIEKI